MNILETIKSSKLYPDEDRLIHFIIWIGILLPSLIRAGTPRFPRLFIQLMAMLLLFMTLFYCFRKGNQKLYYYSNLDILVICFVLFSAFSTFTVSYKHNAQSCFILIISFVVFYFHILGYFSIKDLEKLW